MSHDPLPDYGSGVEHQGTSQTLKVPENLHDAHEKKVKLLTVLASKNRSQRQSPTNLDSVKNQN
jgi:hypothetical protein